VRGKEGVGLSYEAFVVVAEVRAVGGCVRGTRGVKHWSGSCCGSRAPASRTLCGNRGLQQAGHYVGVEGSNESLEQFTTSTAGGRSSYAEILITPLSHSR